MEYMILLGSCINCGRLICYSPSNVPSITLKGKREPLCIDCFNRWNDIHRVKKGLDPVALRPNAYGPEEVQ